MRYCKSVVTDTLMPLPESVTVCATVDEYGDEHVITELMIRRACEQMDDDQFWPCGSEAAGRSLRPIPVKTATIIPFRLRA